MPVSQPGTHRDWKPRHNPWVVALTVTLATFMEVLDTSIANVALPHIAGILGASLGRGHLGPHQLPGLQRDRAAHLRLALRPLRTQAFLHVLRRCSSPSAPSSAASHRLFRC